MDKCVLARKAPEEGNVRLIVGHNPHYPKTRFFNGLHEFDCHETELVALQTLSEDITNWKDISGGEATQNETQQSICDLRGCCRISFRTIFRTHVDKAENFVDLPIVDNLLLNRHFVDDEGAAFLLLYAQPFDKQSDSLELLTKRAL